jgi:hypothetical protein
MSVFLAIVEHPAFLATIPPVVIFGAIGLLFQPVMPAAHRHGVRATRVIRRLEQERARYRRPIGWQSPAWTVQREAVTR